MISRKNYPYHSNPATGHQPPTKSVTCWPRTEILCACPRLHLFSLAGPKPVSVSPGVAAASQKTRNEEGRNKEKGAKHPNHLFCTVEAMDRVWPGHP